jgi:hypothetical protein
MAFDLGLTILTALIDIVCWNSICMYLSESKEEFILENLLYLNWSWIQ